MARTDKKESIIQAAQKRFAHFGVDKTTMNEIADDLSLSKASLYYYFPDKLNLYAAVLHKIMEAEDVDKKKSFLNEPDPLTALLNFLHARTEFIIQYYNILEHLKIIGTSFPKELQPIFNAARTREINLISSIMAKGAETGALKINEPGKIAELLLDCLNGLRLSVIAHQTNFFPNKKQFQEMLNREKKLVEIFIRGLSG